MAIAKIHRVAKTSALYVPADSKTSARGFNSSAEEVSSDSEERSPLVVICLASALMCAWLILTTFPNSVGNLAAKEEARGTIRTHQILQVPVHSPAYCEGPTVAENFFKKIIQFVMGEVFVLKDDCVQQQGIEHYAQVSESDSKRQNELGSTDKNIFLEKKRMAKEKQEQVKLQSEKKQRAVGEVNIIKQCF